MGCRESERGRGPTIAAIRAQDVHSSEYVVILHRGVVVEGVGQLALRLNVEGVGEAVVPDIVADGRDERGKDCPKELRSSLAAALPRLLQETLVV